MSDYHRKYSIKPSLLPHLINSENAETFCKKGGDRTLKDTYQYLERLQIIRKYNGQERSNKVDKLQLIVKEELEKRDAFNFDGIEVLAI
jgi:hypothetical protein